MGGSRGKGRRGSAEKGAGQGGEALGCYSPYLLELLYPAEGTACNEEKRYFPSHLEDERGPQLLGAFSEGQSLWGVGDSLKAFPVHSAQIGPLRGTEILSQKEASSPSWLSQGLSGHIGGTNAKWQHQ